jgi:hypothetical protein
MPRPLVVDFEASGFRRNEGMLIRPFAVHRNFVAKLDADVELLPVEREGLSLCWSPLPEDQPVDHKRMVVLPSPLDGVDPANCQRLKVGWLSLSIESI